MTSRCPRFQKYCTAMAMPRQEKKCWRPCLEVGLGLGVPMREQFSALGMALPLQPPSEPAQDSTEHQKCQGTSISTNRALSLPSLFK